MLLARERRHYAGTAAGGCTELAAALAALLRHTLALVADAEAAQACAAVEEALGCSNLPPLPPPPVPLFGGSSLNDGTTPTARGLPFGQPARTTYRPVPQMTDAELAELIAELGIEL